MNKKNIIFIVLFMVLILILAILPVDEIKIEIKHHFGFLSSIRSQLQRTFNIEISFAKIQNYLHIPFFAILSLLWMKFFRKKKADLVKAIGYTLIIVTIFSIFEESCQYFTPRDASAKDLIFNFIGSLLGIGVYQCTVEKTID